MRPFGIFMYFQLLCRRWRISSIFPSQRIPSRNPQTVALPHSPFSQSIKLMTTLDFTAPAGVEMDLGNLTAFDTRVGTGATVDERAQGSTQVVINALFSLPKQSGEEGKLVKLPKGTTRFPRQQGIPKERALTKWETFAKEKGIQKKRRDRLVLDDKTGEYVPRYGKGSKNALHRDVILPHKEGMADDADPFAVKRKEKKERVKENEKKKQSNLRRAGKKQRLEPMQALDVAKRGPSGKKYLPKKGLKDSLTVVQRSTASAGMFDKKVAKEPKQRVQGRKKKFETVSNRGSMEAERMRSQKIAERMLLGKK